MNAMIWNEEADRVLRDNWKTNSGSEIARMLNTTRNSVIGRAHRLNLEGKPSPIRRKYVDPVAAEASYKAFIQTSYETAKDDDQKCADVDCGEPRFGRKPYCARHCALYYQKPKRPERLERLSCAVI